MLLLHNNLVIFLKFIFLGDKLTPKPLLMPVQVYDVNVPNNRCIITKELLNFYCKRLFDGQAGKLVDLITIVLKL